MENIIVSVMPFTLKHQVFVMKDGDMVENIYVTMDEIPDAVRALSNKYKDIDNISLCGNTEFLEKLKTEINSKFDTKAPVVIISH